MRYLLLVAILLLASSSHSFRNTESESYTDPDFLGYKPERVLLLCENISQEARKAAEKRLIKALGKAGVVATRYYDLFPPTRKWGEDARIKRMEEESIDSILVVTGGASSASVIPIATQSLSSGSVYVYGNSASYSGSATSYNVAVPKSRAEFSAVLFTRDARVAWYADIVSKASGKLFVSDRGNGKGAAIGVIRALVRDGHIEG